MGNVWPRGESGGTRRLCCFSVRPVIEERRSEENRDHKRHGLEGHKTRVIFDRRIISKYDVGALIGRGAFSKVVRVEDKVTKEPLALKIVEIQSANVQSLKTELGILRKVRHRRVVQLREFYVGSSYLYMVMELATGGDLLDRIIVKGKFAEREAGHITDMLLDGLGYLHSNGITHRDLKPENLLFYHSGSDSRILMSDFGLSYYCCSSRRAVMVTPCGTPEYIAPEVLKKKPYTEAVDMWALGVIVYLLVSGRFPFYDESRPKLYRRIVKADYNYESQEWRGISADGKDFIDRLLTVEPILRMTAEEGTGHPWVTGLRGASPCNGGNVNVSSRTSGSIAPSLPAYKKINYWI